MKRINLIYYSPTSQLTSPAPNAYKVLSCLFLIFHYFSLLTFISAVDMNESSILFCLNQLSSTGSNTTSLQLTDLIQSLSLMPGSDGRWVSYVGHQVLPTSHTKALSLSLHTVYD